MYVWFGLIFSCAAHTGVWISFLSTLFLRLLLLEGCTFFTSLFISLLCNLRWKFAQLIILLFKMVSSCCRLEFSFTDCCCWRLGVGWGLLLDILWARMSYALTVNCRRLAIGYLIFFNIYIFFGGKVVTFIYFRILFFYLVEAEAARILLSYSKGSWFHFCICLTPALRK